ncbi:hypothetical protein [Paeniglutamicibacter sp. Y32M11]|jgi:hypothetical protein|uniref:hypothetical protein n=1 Tax=Paeniglutamicibacter sp. Y32M11 TaxID=2853258 RepID=UPI001C52C25E|nr:hypothetical protein [Paeniglutamicibacter sp. Y32M11]QXQ10730.1 hypothetical protein KUF55_01920 [Paeniglutamicibacter sp. Y32M11]
MAINYRDVLREIAYDNYGYVITADAVDVGVLAVDLPKLKVRNGLYRRGQGLYRMADLPPTPPRNARLRGADSGASRNEGFPLPRDPRPAAQRSAPRVSGQAPGTRLRTVLAVKARAEGLLTKVMWNRERKELAE